MSNYGRSTGRTKAIRSQKHTGSLALAIPEFLPCDPRFIDACALRCNQHKEMHMRHSELLHYFQKIHMSKANAVELGP